MSEVGPVVIVGPGRMGLTLGYALVQCDAVRELVYFGRRPEPPSHPLFGQGLARYVFGMEAPPAGCEALFLAVPEAAVPEMAHTLAAQGQAPEGAAAFHLSGVLTTDVLAPLHARGYAVGSFHPLHVASHPVTSAETLPGSYVAVTGGPRAVSVARGLTAALGCPLLTLPETWRALYHAGVTLAAGYLPALLDTAARALERAGVPHEDALPALIPLVRGTLHQIAVGGANTAVGGPIASGDLEGVDLHMRALEPRDRRLYAAVGREVARLAGVELDDSIREALLERFDAAVGG